MGPFNDSVIMTEWPFLKISAPGFQTKLTPLVNTSSKVKMLSESSFFFMGTKDNYAKTET